MRLSMRVWDLPIRLFHAGVMLLLILGVATASTRHWRWHGWVGEAVAALLVWRVIWGVVGSETARLAGWMRGPWRDFGQADRVYAGGWWIALMLALIAGEVGSGWAGSLARVHVALGWMVLGVIVLHVGMVGVHAMRVGDNPVRAIVSGKQRMPAAMRAPRMASVGLAGLVLFCAAGAVVLVVNMVAR